MDTYEGDNQDPLSLHKYLYCAGNPVNGSDPSGHETLVELNTVMGQIANLSRMTLRVVNAYQKAKSVVDAINFLTLLADIVQGGQLSTYINDGLAQFGSAIDGQKAIESLEENLPKLLSRSFPIWSQYLLVRGQNVKGFAIWLPNPGLLPQMRIPAGKIRGMTLTLVAGGRDKSGTIVGVVLRMPGVPACTDLQQIWRMDYHPTHWKQGANNSKPSEISPWADGPFHYHIMYPGQ